MNKLSNILLLSLFLSTSAFADWQLSNDESNINFTSIKSANIGEVHHFNTVNGSINDAGEVSLAIDLASVETNIEIRNERMKSILFDTEKFTTATVKGAVDLTKVKALKVGDTFVEPVTLTLSLHGISHQVTNKVQITKLNNGKLLVTSLMPVIINASDYSLEDGVEKLRDVAKLASIDTAIPVSFNLIFQ